MSRFAHLEHVLALAANQLLGRFIKRVLAMAVAAIFVLGVLYELSVAGTLQLSSLYGPVCARLIVAGIYAVIVLGTLGVLFATRTKAPALPKQSDPLGPRSDERIAMLVESILLGYSMARKRRS